MIILASCTVDRDRNIRMGNGWLFEARCSGDAVRVMVTMDAIAKLWHGDVPAALLGQEADEFYRRLEDLVAAKLIGRILDHSRMISIYARDVG